MNASVHHEISGTHQRLVNVDDGLKALPSDLGHSLDRQEHGVFKLQPIAHLLAAVETNKNFIDHFCSGYVGDEVFVDRFVQELKRDIVVHCAPRHAPKVAHGDPIMARAGQTIKFWLCAEPHAGMVNGHSPRLNKQRQPSILNWRSPLRHEVERVRCTDALPANASNARERNQHGASDFQCAISMRAEINANHSFDQFGFANLSNEKLGRHNWFNHFVTGRLLRRVHVSSLLKSSVNSFCSLNFKIKNLARLAPYPSA